MTTKSPTTSVKSREIIGVDQFSRRREVFGKHDTVFLPLPSPTNTMAYSDVQQIVTSNHGKTTTNFKRNAPTYSSMRETRTDRDIEFRPRKYSDNFTSELNQSDDVEYRFSMTERTRRLSKLRRDFLNSNLHEPNHDSPFARTGTRASMPVQSKYKIESPNLYKFPFAEPYATPPPVRRVVVDFGTPNGNGEKENEDPETKPKHQSMPTNNETSSKVDHQKLFEELVKRYSPQRKEIDWKIPPTRPRVVGSVPKSTSSVADSIDSNDKKVLEETVNKSAGDDDVFAKQEVINDGKKNEHNLLKESITANNSSAKGNGPETLTKGAEEGDLNRKSKDDKESEEKYDEVPELSSLQIHSKEPKKPALDKYTDITIPALIEKMTEEGADLESHKTNKKVKRKRSFLDKLLGRKKDK